MNEPVFYVLPDNAGEQHLILDKVESHHAVTVMRLTPGAIVVAVDGNSTAYRGEITVAKKNKPVEIKVHAVVRNYGEPDTILTLAAGISTSSKFETVIEKGTELGVKRFVPLICEKGKVKLDDPKRIKTKIARYRKIALAAMKQCRRSFTPEITHPTSFQEFMNSVDPESNNFIFHPSQKSLPVKNISFDKPSKRVLILVGPESGFSETEIELAEKNHLIPISLGKRILRTETAGPVISALIMQIVK